MQNLKGQPSGALCGSELVCAFDRKVLPIMLAAHRPQNRAAFMASCKRFAVKLGLPESEWTSVTLPNFISLDHDPRHAWLFQRLSAPRVSAAELERRFAEVIKEVLGKDLPALPGPQAFNLTGDRQAIRAAASARALRNEILGKWDKHCEDTGRNPWKERLWDLARTNREYVCILPQQRFPLVPVTPDVHSPAEHMVRTVKVQVREYVLNMDPASSLLKKGVTYQRMVDLAVHRRGNSASGLHQIRRSIAKLPCICQILAAELSEEIEVEFDFDTKPTANETQGKRKKGRRVKARTWKVLGRAGRWIRYSKFT